jgi:hypothetical protein
MPQRFDVLHLHPQTARRDPRRASVVAIGGALRHHREPNLLLPGCTTYLAIGHAEVSAHDIDAHPPLCGVHRSQVMAEPLSSLGVTVTEVHPLDRFMALPFETVLAIGGALVCASLVRCSVRRSRRLSGARCSGRRRGAIVVAIPARLGRPRHEARAVTCGDVRRWMSVDSYPVYSQCHGSGLSPSARAQSGLSQPNLGPFSRSHTCTGLPYTSAPPHRSTAWPSP